MIDLGVHIERVARHLFGEPNRALSTRHQLRFGTNGSVAVEIAGSKRGTWFDHENKIGGGTREMLLAQGQAADEAGVAEWFRRELGIDVNPDKRRIVATYDYTDEKGAVLFQVVRFADHKFLQRRPDGTGGWIWKRGGRLVLYRLPELLAGKRAGNGHPPRIFLTEGEKDCDRLRKDWGVTATTNPGGAGNWDPSFDPYFAGFEVILLEDNDEAGRKRTAKLAPQLTRAGAIVKVIRFPHLDEGGDISDWLDAGGSQSDLETLIEGIPPFELPGPGIGNPSDPIPGQPEVRSAGRDYGPIPPRRWLLGTNFCIGFLSGLTGAGAAGKTAIRLLQCIALALGRGDLTGEHVFKRTKVLIVCLEDDEDEVRRRVRAACIYHNITESDLDGWLYYWTPRDLRLLEVDQHGHAEPGELGDALRQIIKQLDIGLVSVDPFVKSHGAEENDNSLIDRAATLFLQVAHDCGCACDYVHHHRKGIAIAGDPDSARGAGALVNASRLVKTATKMSEKDADQFKVGERDRKLLVRLDDAKLNIAPPAEEAIWFKLVGVDIGNPSEDYPKGDNVQTVERWYPPPPAAGLTKTKVAEIFDELRAGPGDGEFYSPDQRAKERWAGIVIIEETGKSEAEARRLLRDWIKNGVLIEGEYTSPRLRKKRGRVTLVETKAVEILGPLYRPPGVDA
jgi:AAA domain